MRHRKGFTIVEAVVAALLFVAATLVVVQLLGRSADAARADNARSEAVRDEDRLLRRMHIELAQTSSHVDPALPPGERQRIWLVPNGVRFQKVVGHDVDAGNYVQRWSPEITYAWNPATRRVTRSEDGGASAVVGVGVADFGVTTNGDGQVVVWAETERGAANRGTAARHRRTVRITPRNLLK